MTGQNQGGKGNPAHKRMSNQNLKNRRAASWNRGQRRKQERRDEQAAREAANRERRANGEPTPWELAKAARRAVRRLRGKEVA